jgi:hypothetical protein
MPTIERTPIAAWSAADGSTTWKTIDWPVRGERLNRRSLVEFAYTTGGCRLDVRSVELLDGAGRSLARDAHVGRTGTANVANRYVLAMPADPDNAATYTLRVVIRTDGGTDSNGVVNVLRRAGL